jgi:hypothetical protein
MTMSDRNIMIARVLRESEVVRNHRRGASRPLQFERRSDEVSATTAPSARLMATARGISASASVESGRLAGRGTGG